MAVDPDEHTQTHTIAPDVVFQCVQLEISHESQNASEVLNLSFKQYGHF